MTPASSMQPERLDLFRRSAQTAAEDHRVHQPGPALFEALVWIPELQVGQIRGTELLPELARADVPAIEIQVGPGLDGEPVLPVRCAIARAAVAEIRVYCSD